MLGLTNFLVRHLLNFLFTIISVVLLDYFDIVDGWFSIIAAILIYIISNVSIKNVQKYKKSKAFGLTRSEYSLIESQIKQARSHINSLTQQYIRVRSIRSFKLINEMTKLSRRIVNIVQANPQKFYTVEEFFYSHLPSAVQLSKNYTMLVQQQIKDRDVNLALEEARKAMKSLQDTMEEDLKAALSADIENLKLELDYVKMEREKKQQQIEFRREDQ
ncbi:5-bromo-4-chloroindolyl phosphate hydrolysis family protein [Ureibacillus thermophilus]|uniref:5-bromo-4-chloroindolyl phosphate hydrolase n=1 Tax=Ureibacillus thermophilus TaxID=367743 RepID=A0A4P6URY2_9BACL|nr:5-bromo-4-chloroindolyl phosphate hydrolysis family protein [Ureibacillus thermophilus]QBK26019.1 5-bromo-4-chloroindolyl phosphate hydrolase [Ureibacillus thermophilus]